MIKKLLIGVIAVFASSGFLFFDAKPDGLLHVYFLNVGQGDSILLRTPQGKNILVDGGPGNKVLTELKETLPFFKSSLDYVILTHPDRDHIEGLIYALKRYRVDNVIFSGMKKDYFSKVFLKTINEKNIPITVADENSDFKTEDGVLIDILFPFNQILEAGDKTNDSSIVAEIIYGENEILLTGDADATQEEKLLNNGIEISADVLKISHHGSKTGTSEDFLKAVNPRYGVISVGKGNSYHHPHPSVLKRLRERNSEILRTDQDGRIEFVFSKKGIIEVKTQSMRTISAPSERNFSSNRS